MVEELKDVLRFWMELGVDGFRMDAVAHLFEGEAVLDREFLQIVQGFFFFNDSASDDQFRDEPLAEGKRRAAEYGDLDHQ